jgi:hypothetical protein
MSMRNNIIIGVIVGIALLVGGYLFFFNTTPATTSALSSGNSTASANVAEEKFVQLSDQASSITFDTTILTDPRFTSLIDTHTQLTPVQTGRPDPFAPLSGSGS